MKIFSIHIAAYIFLFVSAVMGQNNEIITRAIPGTEVRDISVDKENVWIATNGDGIIKYKKSSGRWDSYSTNNGKLSNNFFYSVAATPKYVFAGSADGLFILDKKRNRWIKRKFAQGGQLSNWIRTLKYDKKENAVWIGRFKYLTKYDIKKRRFIDYDLTRKSNAKTNTIKVIELDGDSLVWFGTEGGMLRYNKRYGINDASAITFFDNSYNYFLGRGETVSISDILFEQNYIWIGTDELVTERNPLYNLGGLFRFDRKNEWIRFDNEDGLTGSGIYSIELVGKYIWVTTYQFDKKLRERYGRGLSIIDRTNLTIKKIYNKDIPELIYKIYFDGKFVWLGTNDGIVKINLENDLNYLIEE